MSYKAGIFRGLVLIDAWGHVGFFKVHMITGLRLPLRLPHVLFVEMLLESLL